MNSNSTLLTPEELQKVEWGEALDRDYFYIPVITYSEPSILRDTMWYSLRFNILKRDPEPDSLLLYASKVPAGQTLWQTVRSDLEKDFKYPHNERFTIESAKPWDKAKNKQGQELSRVIVDVQVDKMFSTRNLFPLDMDLVWYFEGEDVFGPDLGLDKIKK